MTPISSQDPRDVATIGFLLCDFSFYKILTLSKMPVKTFELILYSSELKTGVSVIDVVYDPLQFILLK